VPSVHIEDLTHFLAPTLVPTEHNRFRATLRMIGKGNLDPMTMGVMKGIRAARQALWSFFQCPPRSGSCSVIAIMSPRRSATDFAGRFRQR
jgi:hypothetical protein